MSNMDVSILDGVTWANGRVHVSKLVVDPRLQRPLDLVRVDDLLKRYTPAALGTVTVSRRKNGSMVVLDGQHRKEVVKRAHDADRNIDAKIYEGLTIQQEALLFKLLNDTKRLTPLVLFKIAVIEKDPVAVACNKILVGNKLVAEPGHPNSFQAVVALTKLYDKDPVAAAITVQFLTTAWGHVDRDALDGRLVTGAGWFFAKYGEDINQGQLAAKLRKAGTPGWLIGEARTLAKIKSVQVAHAVAEKLVGLYNKGRPEDRWIAGWGH